MNSEYLRVLVVDDDEDDFLMIKSLLSRSRFTKFQVDLASTYEQALEAVRGVEYDACLLDFFLGARNGLELLRELYARGLDIPAIMLTGQNDYEIEIEAMHSGAADYLTKGLISAALLERSIRYSVERKRTERELRKARNELEIRVIERTTDFEAANRALKESEERSRLLVESAWDIIYTISPDFKLLSLNPAFQRITGWSAEEWIGQDYSSLIHPEDRSASMEGISKTLNGEARPAAEIRLLSNDGGYKTIECRTVPLFKGGEIVGIIGTAHDVTSRKQMEDALRRANDMLESRVAERTAELARANEALRLEDMRLQALWDLSQKSSASIEEIANFVVDQQVRLTGSKVGWLGFTDEKGTFFTVSACSMRTAHNCTDLPVCYPVESAGLWAEIIERGEPVVHNEGGFFKDIEVCPNDRQPLFRFMGVPVFDGDMAAAIALVGNKEEDYNQSDLRQLTLLMDGIWKLIQRERALKALRESESLAAMGTALSSVAHDIKTPLIAIGGFTRLVQNHLKNDDPDREKLAIVLKETRRLEMMVRDMLDFSRPLELERSREDFSALLSETAAVVETVAREKKVALRMEVDQPVGAVFMDVQRMKQVLINLMMNAVQASPSGQTVLVRVHKMDLRLAVDVVDCGCGVPVDKRREIFSPFFTTKKEGTGLGLPIVKKIVEAHEGYVEIIDNPGSGVTFRVLIPTGR